MVRAVRVLEEAPRRHANEDGLSAFRRDPKGGDRILGPRQVGRVEQGTR